MFCVWVKFLLIGFAQLPAPIWPQEKFLLKLPAARRPIWLVGLARLGESVAFIGRLSSDAFGTWLKSILIKEGIDVQGVVTDPQSQTRMAYVITTADGDRHLATFSNVACADARLEPDDLNPDQFARASMLHFGSISLIADPCAKATQKAVNMAKNNGLIISYDPNIRIALWPNAALCKEKILSTLACADLVKMNEDELFFLTGSRDLLAANALAEKYAVTLLIITLASRGAYFTHAAGSKIVAGYDIQSVEATGAGDGFNAGVLSGLLRLIGSKLEKKRALAQLKVEEITSIIRRANAVGALTCSKAGAIPALPTSIEVDRFLQSAQPKLDQLPAE